MLYANGSLFSLSYKSDFETGGGDNAKSDKNKICVFTNFRIEVSITRDVISPGGPTCPIATIIGFLEVFMSNWACFEICAAVYTSSKIIDFQ